MWHLETQHLAIGAARQVDHLFVSSLELHDINAADPFV
jgi:hypothetical protein